MEKNDLNILLVEDSKTSAMITTSLIKSLSGNYTVKLAKSLKEAIEKSKKENFDVALLDLMLPDSSGIDTFISFNKVSSSVPVIILSSSNDESVILKAIELGAQDYIFKEELAKNLLRKSILYALERNKFAKTLEEKNKIIKENERIFKEILYNYPDGVFLLDETKRIMLVNDYGKRFFGKSEEELVGNEFELSINFSTIIETEIQVGEEKKAVEIMARKIRFNKSTFFIVSLRDITEKKKLQEQLNFYATKDSLTGFYNRRYGLILTEQSLKIAKRKNEYITLCFVDIDNLKYANDKFGHGMGDELIKTVAEGIISIVRDSDIATRLGGDEFLITFLNANTSIAKSVMSRVEYKIYTLAKKRDFPFEVSISKGFSEYNPNNDINLDKLIEIADSNMYDEKIKKKKKK